MWTKGQKTKSKKEKARGQKAITSLEDSDHGKKIVKTKICSDCDVFLTSTETTCVSFPNHAKCSFKIQFKSSCLKLILKKSSLKKTATSLQPATLLKGRLRQRCFPVLVNFSKFFIEHLRRAISGYYNFLLSNHIPLDHELSSVLFNVFHCTVQSDLSTRFAFMINLIFSDQPQEVECFSILHSKFL